MCRYGVTGVCIDGRERVIGLYVLHSIVQFEIFVWAYLLDVYRTTFDFMDRGSWLRSGVCAVRTLVLVLRRLLHCREIWQTNVSKRQRTRLPQPLTWDQPLVMPDRSLGIAARNLAFLVSEKGLYGALIHFDFTVLNFTFRGAEVRFLM